MRSDGGIGPDPAHRTADGDGNTPAGGGTRRAFLVGAAAAAGGGVAGWLAHGAIDGAAPTSADAQTLRGTDAATLPSSSVTAPAPLPAGHRIPGITDPAVPQRHTLVTVLTVPGIPAPALARAMEAARSAASTPSVYTADAGAVTVVVGYSPAHARALWPARAARATTLPAFARDTADIVTGGDVCIQVCAETAAAAASVVQNLRARMPRSVVRWRQAGYRDAPTPAGTMRTSSGFIDGITNPRSAHALNMGVWAGSGHRDTYVVYRRMTVDAAFARQGLTARERALGRHYDDGRPLSGGGPLAAIDLYAKTPDGHLKTPLNAHVRRAHPVNIGRPLMLRRSYTYDPPAGTGLIFSAYMADPATFISTQRRLDEADDFLAHASTDASGCFFVPEPHINLQGF